MVKVCIYFVLKKDGRLCFVCYKSVFGYAECVLPDSSVDIPVSVIR